MAGTNWHKTPNLEQWIQALQERPHEFSFFQALRLVECLFPDRSRLGTAKVPANEPPLRLAQEPAMTFAPAGLAAFEAADDGKPAKLLVRFLGFLGPNGPLPLHLTEYAYMRQHLHKDPTFAHFLDIFNHRMLSLFYRAWANSEPTVGFDRPASDRFSVYVGSLAGLGMPAWRDRDAFSDLSKFYYCGRLANQTRNAEGLQEMLADCFNVTARIQEFVGEWMEMPERDLSLLGIESANGNLGQSVVLGPKIWCGQFKFRVVLGPLAIEDYELFLPGGEGIGHLVALVRNYIGDELAWDVQLILKQDQVPGARLDGQCQLGWGAWLDHPPCQSDAADLVFDAVASVKNNQHLQTHQGKKT